MRNQPIITLEALLRRRKTNLQAYLLETGITTYNLLTERCSRMGVQPPAPHIFEQYRPPTAPVSSPTEGVVILPPPDLIGNSAGSRGGSNDRRTGARRRDRQKKEALQKLKSENAGSKVID